MKTKHVIVVPYDEKWPEEFTKIKEELKAAMGNRFISIEHVGSTSVHGLAAKPIIDIDVIIKKDMFTEVKKALEAIGYVHEGDLGIKGREAFKYDHKEHLMTHHLYVCFEDCPELHRHITFRNWLRSHPEDVMDYSKVKMDMSKKYPYDIDSYIEGKSPCIEKIYKKCGL